MDESKAIEYLMHFGMSRLLPYDKLGLAAPMRERGSVQVEEYREDGLYLEGIVKTEDLHCFEGYLV